MTRWRAWRFRRVLAAKSPLPDWMRERFYIQRICQIAQDAYQPRRGSFDVAVFHAPALYHAGDLGWRDQTDGQVHCFEVPGDGQHTPRRTMREPYVEFIAEQLVALQKAGSGVTQSA